MNIFSGEVVIEDYSKKTAIVLGLEMKLVTSPNVTPAGYP